MAVTYPYPLAFLADLLDIESVEFDVERNDMVSGQGSGKLISAELAPPYWYADISLNPAYLDDAEVIAAKMRKLHGPMGTFFLYDPRKLYPKEDPLGTIIGATAQTVTAKGSDNASPTITGFPANYKLSPGDKFCFQYGGDGYGFHEISDYAQASGAGQVVGVPVFPHLPSGMTLGTVVSFAKPFARMQLDQGGWKPGRGAGLHTSGMSFRALQKV